MNINATLAGYVILLLMVIAGFIAYRLARRKIDHPKLIATLCALLCLFPPMALLALLILALWRDKPALQS
ncbi:hypothetical protein ACW5XF_19030 [Aeromonas lusitana]|uniref:Uncharacterized protein n=1 Tax=Aeromonas lusitana TaxID=931529 RepID=A0A2M8H8S9_9GAMM|nr:hypothetical protein [Aeromonas lusitana]PJC92966.1 hypothetical protein CUC44_11665 [Aeromonas lusitana]